VVDGSASDLKTFLTLDHDGAAVRSEGLDVDGGAWDHRYLRCEFVSDGLDAAMHSSGTVDVDSVVAEEADEFVYV
jgi:hypothetical protein